MATEARRSDAAIAHAIVFVSGLCALVYQIAWARAFIPAFGLSVYATTAVVAAFMTGLGIGSHVAPKLLDRWRGDPWRLYALVEAGIGAGALCVPLSIGPITRLYLAAAESVAGPPLMAIRFGLAASAMLVPTLLMGLTLPIVVHACAAARGPEGADERGRTAGTLYGVNTAGAAVGCVLVGFFLLFEYGTRLTIASMAALNAAVALCALAMSRRSRGARGVPQPSPPPAPSVAARAAGPGTRTLLAAYGLIGVASFGFEIAWFRVLVLYLQSATHSFSILLASYLSGLACGSLAYSRWIEPRLRGDRAWTRGVQTLVIGQLALAVIASLTFPVAKAWIPPIWALLIHWMGADSWGVIAFQKTAVASVIIVPPTLIMGATFPLLVGLYRRAAGASDAASVGRLYAANTAGAVVGSVLTGFVLFDAFGVQGTIVALSTLTLCIGLALALTSAPLGRRFAFAIGAFACAFLAVQAATPRRLLASAIEESRDMDVIFYRETAADVTMVGRNRRHPEIRQLIFHDGRGTCTTAHVGNYDNRMFAYSTLVQDPDARDVLVISMGCGNTASAFAAFPIESLDIVDLSRSAFEAARLFEATNLGVLRDPRVRTFADDGRNYLLKSSRTYDVIQLEPPSIHTDGVVYLYTTEFYEIARRRLRAGGVLSQWIDTGQIGREAGYVLVNTMRNTFEDLTVWSSGAGVWWVNGRVGPRDGPPIDASKVNALFSRRRVVADMRRVGTSLPDVLANIIASPAAVARIVADRPVITDDRTYIDFLTPRIKQPYALGGGVGYYNSVLRPLFRDAWKAHGTFRGEPRFDHLFHPPHLHDRESGRAIDAALVDFPADFVREVRGLRSLEERRKAVMPQRAERAPDREATRPPVQPG